MTAGPAQSIIVDVRIDAAEFSRYYYQPGAQVVVQSQDGRTVRFPANLLQRFVTHQGVAGRFVIHYTESGQFSAIERLVAG